MAKKAKNYKKDLKAALSALSDLPGQTVAMHLALATSEYDKIDDISDKTLLDLITNYISIHEMYDGGFTPAFNEFEEDEEGLYDD